MDTARQEVQHAQSKVLLLDFHYHVLGFKNEDSLAPIPHTGLSSDHVLRETKRARAGLTGPKTQLWPRIDIDIPTADHSKCTPKGVHNAVKPAFDGADGVILSRKYSEMKLANLAGAGQAIKAT